MSRTSFSIAGLAALALSGSLVLAAPTAYAGSCDPLPSDDIVTTIVHPAVVRTVPASTHTEWVWERDLVIEESEFAKLVAAASLDVDWTREVPGPVEYRFARTVIDRPAVPAVPGTPELGHPETVVVTPAVLETEDEYLHETTGKLRWERSDWGAQHGQGKGWSKTGATREVETSPAVTQQRWVVDVPATPAQPGLPELSHVEEAWSSTSPGADWTATGDERRGPGGVETRTTDGAAPSGDGWREVARRETAPVVETVWAATAPEGYLPTGSSRVAAVTQELTATTSAAAPEGEGWAALAGSEVVVTDVAAYEELLSEQWIELLLSPPRVPEGCEGPRDEVESPEIESPEIEPPATEEVASVNPAMVLAQVSGQGAPAVAPTVLPNTGGTSGWMAPAGLASVLAGAAIALRGRRRGVR